MVWGNIHLAPFCYDHYDSAPRGRSRVASLRHAVILRNAGSAEVIVWTTVRLGTQAPKRKNLASRCFCRSGFTPPDSQVTYEQSGSGRHTEMTHITMCVMAG